MTRWLSILIVVAAAAAPSGCNTPSCGPGTKQVQQKDGNVQCVAVDAPAATIPCDVDMGGAAIVGGRCVSAVKCGPNTTLVNGQCIGTGSMGGPPPCSPPSPGNICVNGALHNFVDNMPFTGTVRVAVYNPLDFLSPSPAMPIVQSDFSGGGYIFPDVPAPPLQLLAIAVGDADLGTTRANATYVTAGSGAQGVNPGNSYQIDGYVLPRAVVDGWKMQTGTDWLASGAYIAKFYADAKPAPTMLTATETMPVMGVQLLAGASVAAGTKYFGTSLTMIQGTLTSTSAVGAAITPAPPGGIAMFTGMGGGITWETEQGGSAPKIIFISRFHPQ